MKIKHKFATIFILLSIAIFLIKTDEPKMADSVVSMDLSTRTIKDIKEKELAMSDAEYWIRKIEDKDKILMDEAAIIKFNKDNFSQYEELKDLRNLNPYIKKDELISLIKKKSQVPKSKRYNKNGNVVTKEYYEKLLSNLNLNMVKDKTPIRYGVAVNRTMIKTFPTFDGSYKIKGDLEFDRFMETAVYPWEPIAIYSESKDGEWYFGSTYNYTGWIPKKDIAEGEKDIIFNYIDQRDFLIVVDRQITIDKVLYDMGVKLPLVQDKGSSFLVNLPKRNNDGKLLIETIELDSSGSFNKGYLPYTKENLLKQAFKLYGEPYGWGGMNNTRDCSAFLLDIHRTFGFELPRNASEQGQNSLGKVYEFKGNSNLEGRLKVLDSVAPGTALYMPGHAMLYIGKDNGKHYMIHQFAGYYEKQGNKYVYKRVMKTEVTPVTIKTSTGKTYIENVYVGKEFSRN